MKDVSRRDALKGVTALFVANGGGGFEQVDSDTKVQPGDYEGVAYLIGTERPAPDQIKEDTAFGGWIFENEETGAKSYLRRDNSQWRPLNYIQHQPVFSSSDLPAPTNGTHTLEDQTAYHFYGFVTSPYGIELGTSTPLIGRHGSVDGFIHVGGNTAITGTDAGYFARDLYFHAPGGTMFNLSANNDTEMLVESCSYSDAAGLGDIASLGTVTGYRVPTWKGCNFENFAGGLTFDGNPDKIFIWGSPFRSVSASGVTMLTLASTASCQIVDFADNYAKDVQSDTEIWRVETGGSPSEVFQYRGTVHDTSVNVDNILTGEASASEEPYWVSDSYPLVNSNVIGELSLDGETTTTINATGTWYQVTGATTVGNETQRMIQSSAGVLEYTATKDTNTHVTINTTFTGSNGDIYRIALGKNGTVEPASTMQVEAGGQNAPVSVSTSGIEDLQTGDTISLLVQNQSATNNATFQAYTISSLGI